MKDKYYQDEENKNEMRFCIIIIRLYKYADEEWFKKGYSTYNLFCQNFFYILFFKLSFNVKL